MQQRAGLPGPWHDTRASGRVLTTWATTGGVARHALVAPGVFKLAVHPDHQATGPAQQARIFDSQLGSVRFPPNAVDEMMQFLRQGW